MQLSPTGTKTQLSIKSTLTLALAWLCCSAAMPQTNALEPQRAALTQVGQALSRVVIKAKKVNEQLGYGFTEGGCVFGVKLRPGSSTSETFSLKAGQSYVFIGSGDKTARNVDIVLRDASGRIVCQDIEADAAPFIPFQPKNSGRYTMSLALKSGWSGSAFCAVTILRKGGVRLPIERIIEAAIRMNFASLAAFREANGGRFNEAPGTWGLYGAVIRQGQAMSTAPKRYNATNNATHRGIVAVGDSRVRDLDLALVNGSGKTVATDLKNGAAPKVTRSIGVGTYAVRVSNQSSSGPALVMAVLLDLPATHDVPKGSEPAPTSTPALPSNAQQALTFEGDWKGDWADENRAREGTFKMRVKSDGSLSGRLEVPTLKVVAKFKGVISADGTLHFTYTQSKQGYVADGIIKFPKSDDQRTEVPISFSTDGKVFGNAALFLERSR